MTLTLCDASTEKALVRCALTEPTLFGNTIKPGDIFTPELRAVWQAGRDLHDAGRAVDRNSLADRLEAAGIPQPETLLADLLDVYVSPVFAETYAQTVTKWARYRDLVATWAQIQATSTLGDGNAPDVDSIRQNLMRRLDLLAPAITEDTEPSTWADLPAILGPIVWDWPGWLVRGMLAELVASSGMGKSNLALRIAGTYLCGWPWPDGTPYTGEVGSVLWCEAEAAQKVNLDRAVAWGLPLERLLTPLQNPLDEVDLFSVAHRAAIAARAHRSEVKLIVVDSLSGASGGRERGEEQMPIVKFFAELARDTNKPVLLLHHLRKKSLVDGAGDLVTLDMVRGATQITQLARVVWAVDAPNGNSPEHKRLNIIKNNLARFAEPIGLRIEDAGLIFDDAPTRPRDDSPMNRAIDLLRSLLATGPVYAAKIEEEAAGAGISMKAIREAKEALHVLALRKGSGHGSHWLWSLPTILPQEAG